MAARQVSRARYRVRTCEFPNVPATGDLHRAVRVALGDMRVKPSVSRLWQARSEIRKSAPDIEHASAGLDVSGSHHKLLTGGLFGIET